MTDDTQTEGVAKVAELIKDIRIAMFRGGISELWNPLLRAWFAGPDDPTIRLIRVQVDAAEYWETPGGKVASLISMLKAAVSGNRPDTSGENRTVTF